MNKKRKHHAAPPLPAYLAKRVPPLIKVPGTEKVKQLSIDERTIIASIQRHGPTTEAAQAAGVSPSTISRAFKLPAVQQYLRDELDKLGATDSKILKVINEGLSATSRRDGFDKGGRLLKGEERPDYSERREAAKLALKLKGLDNTPDPEAAGGVTNQSIFNIVIQARAARGLEPKPVIEAETVQPVDLEPPTT